MAADLESSHRDSTAEHSGRWSTYSCETDEGTREEQAITGDEAKLDEGESDRKFEDQHDRLSSVRGECRGCVPEATEEDETHGGWRWHHW